MSREPLMSIIILHHERPDILVRTLRSVQLQTYAQREVIVVVNGSSSDIRRILAPEFPNVRLIELGQNLGACAGRNAGIRAARGDVIITLDNDVAFERSDALTLIAEYLNRRPDVHVLAFRVCEKDTGQLLVRAWCHPRYWKEFNDTEFETNHFNEGACAARREVYEAAGLYYEPLFFGAEGWDLVLRIIECGFRIHYLPSLRVLHLTDDEDRPGSRPYYYYTRAYIWTAVKDYPLTAGVAAVIPKLVMMLYFAGRSGQIGAFARGVKDGVAGIPGVMRDRKPVARSTLKYMRQLEEARPSLWLRLQRHREAVQL